MKVLFISMITGNKFAGPSYSVPATVANMTSFADVSWLNLDKRFEFKQDDFNNVLFASGDEFIELSYEAITDRLGVPDIVVFEDLYNINYCKIAKLKGIHCSIQFSFVALHSNGCPLEILISHRTKNTEQI